VMFSGENKVLLEGLHKKIIAPSLRREGGSQG
jgi:hypothetical protein